MNEKEDNSIDNLVGLNSLDIPELKLSKTALFFINLPEDISKFADSYVAGFKIAFDPIGTIYSGLCGKYSIGGKALDEFLEKTDGENLGVVGVAVPIGVSLGITMAFPALAIAYVASFGYDLVRNFISKNDNLAKNSVIRKYFVKEKRNELLVMHDKYDHNPTIHCDLPEINHHYKDPTFL